MNMLQFVENASLSALNSLAMPAKARWYCEVTTTEELREAIAFAHARSLPIVPLGGGTNIVLLADVDGLLIRNRLLGKTFKQHEATVSSGEGWHAFVEESVLAGRYGLENLALIPGTVGAAPMQNIGAYGVELSDRFVSLNAIHLETGEQSSFGLADCAFGYRDSLFKHEPGYFVTDVTFRFLPEDRADAAYPGITDYLQRYQLPCTAASVFEAVMHVRQSKLPDPLVDPNVGSFFKNPAVTPDKAAELRRSFPDMPAFVQQDVVKLSAAWMIDHAGLKGHASGGFRISEQHALVIVHDRRGKADQLTALIETIRTSVEKKFGVALDIEPSIYP